MGSRFVTTVGKISIVDGAWQERARNLVVVEGTALIPWGRDRGSLYAILEAVGEPAQRESVYQGIVAAIKRTHHKGQGSITSVLRESIKQANEYTFQRNLDVLPHMRVIAGVTCAVLKDEDVYIGQSGPALAYLFQGQSLHRFPTERVGTFPSSFQEASRSCPVPLGAARRPQIDLFHSRLQDGQVIMLSTTGLANLASEETLVEVLSKGDVVEMLSSLEALSRGGDFSAIVIQVEEVDTEVAQPMAEEEETKASEQEAPGELPPVVSVPSMEEREPEGEAEVASWEAPPMEEAEPAKAGEADAMGEAEPKEEIWTLSRIHQRGLMTEQDWQAKVRKLRNWGGDVFKGMQTTLAVVGRGLINFLRLTLPGRDMAPEESKSHLPPLSALLKNKLMLIGMLIPVFVALLVVAALIIRVQSQAARFSTLVEEARELSLAGDRRSLSEALAKVEEALAIRPGDGEAYRLWEALRESLDRVQKVERLYWIDTLWKLDDGSGHPDRLLAVGRSDIYLLDRGLGKWHKFLLDEAGKVRGEAILTQKGDVWDGFTVDGLLDLMLVDSGPGVGSPKVMALTWDGVLLEYDPTRSGLRPIPLAQRERWVDPKAAAGYGGKLYVLDRGQGRILQYVSAGGRYDNPPVDYLDPSDRPELSDVVDMAADVDLWVLKSDGLILKFQEGKRLLFDRAGLERPISDPRAIFTSAATKSIYVADAAGERIVQFSKDGRYERELRCREGEGLMEGLEDLAVDEEQQKVYFLAGKALRVANWPPMGQARMEGGE